MPENWEDEPYKQCENVMRTMLQSSDNGLRKEAEATIARAMRDAANARIFCILLRRSEEAGIRQLSAVLLRRQCHLWFRRMKEEDRALCKEYMLSSLMHEPNRLVRLAVGHAVSTLAKAELRRDHWKELLPVLQSLTKQADDPAAMEVAVLIFYELCEVIVDQYGTQSLVEQVILPSMSHTNVAVNVAGLKVVQELMCILQEDSTHRSTIDLLVPRVLEVIEKKLVHERTMIDACIDVLDVVDSFLMLSIKRHREVVQVVSQTMLRIMQDRAVPCALRHRAMMGLITVAEGKPNYFTQSGLLEHSLRAIASLLCEDDSISEVHVYDLEDTEENEENEDDLHDGFSDSNNPCEIATFYLDAICTNVDPRNSMRPLMNIAESLYEDAVHAPCVRKGALFFTAIPCREYFEALRPHTATLMKTAVESGHPSNPFFVRSAALAALAFHVRYLQPDSLSYHAHIVPLLVDAVRDASSVNIQHKVCLTLETFVENLERDVVQSYIDVIVPNLINVIQHERTSMATRHAAISCLSAAMETRTARAYLSAILPVLEHALYLEKDETMALRAEAVEALSVLAIATGRTDWDPIFPRIFDRIQDGMQRHDFAQLRESTFGFYANMAEVFGADFMVHVPVCLSYILHSIESEDGTVENVHPLAGGGNHVTSSLLELQADESNESEESSSDAGSDLSEAEDLRMRVHRTVIDEKAAAVYALGVLAECVGPPFAQHVPRGLTALRAVQSHFNETVRANAVAAAAKLVVCSHHASMGVVRQDSKAHVGWPSHDTLVPDVRALTDLMVTAILSIFRSDESVAVAGAACEALAVLCEGMGSVGVYPHIDALVEELIHLLRHESFCQTHMEDAEDEDEADAGSQGSGKGAGFSLYDSIGECLEALAKSYGPDFWPLSMKIFPCLWPYVNDLTDTNESITTLAVFTTSIAAMQDVAITLCEPFTHLCLNILRTPNVAGGIVRNAAVLFGQLSLTFSIPQVHLLSARELFYEILKRIAETQPPPPSYDGYVIDNCLSTLCIILRQVEALSPETSDIEYIAKCLPLRADYDEAENIYGTLVWVLEKYHKPSTALEAYMGGVVCCLCEMLADEKIPTQIRTVVIHSLQHAGLIHAVQLQDLHLSNAARSALKSLFFC